MHDNRRTRVLLAVLIVVALLIITVDYSDSSAAPVRALRSLGSAVFGGTQALSQLWLFWVAPILGGVIGGTVARWLHEEGTS